MLAAPPCCQAGPSSSQNTAVIVQVEAQAGHRPQQLTARQADSDQQKLSVHSFCGQRAGIAGLALVSPMRISAACKPAVHEPELATARQVVLVYLCWSATLTATLCVHRLTKL